MGYVCKRPAGSCPRCEHCRYDEDIGKVVCMARIDKTPDIDHNTMTVYATVRARYKALGLIR